MPAYPFYDGPAITADVTAKGTVDGLIADLDAAGIERALVEEELEVNVDEARGVVGALEVATHPVEAVGDAGEHGRANRGKKKVGKKKRPARTKGEKKERAGEIAQVKGRCFRFQLSDVSSFFFSAHSSP